MRAQEKPRPSRKAGNSITTTDKRCTSSPSCSGDSSDLSRTPIGALRAIKVSRSLRKRGSETMAPPTSGSGASSAMSTKGSATKEPPLMSGIKLVQIGHILERLHADATIGIEEAFAVLAQHQIRLD